MLEILSGWINEPLTQSLLLSPLMGVLFAVVFAGFTSSPTTSSPRTIERTTIIYRERIIYKNGRGGNSNSGDGRGIMAVAGFGLLFIIWQYAANAENILYYLAVFILTSLVFCLTTMIISFLKRQFTDDEWWFYTFAPLVFLVISSYLLGVAKNSISPELIQAAQSAIHPISFFSTLTTYGRHLMITQTFGVICLFLLTLSSSAVLIHYLSLMNQRTEGPFRWVWDILVSLTEIASGNAGFILCAIFTLLSWTLIDGIILNMIM